MSNPKVLIRDVEAQWYAENLAKSCPDYTFVPAENNEEALKHASDAEVLIGLAPALSKDLISAASNLKWLQALTTGVDNLLAMPDLGDDVVLTNCAGFHGPQMSELAIYFMLSLPRKIVDMHTNQSRHKWERWKQPLLSGKTVCIVGLGSIAEALAKRCVALEMNVIGVSNGRTTVPGFSKVYRREDLSKAAAQCDFMVVVVPHSEETHHLIDFSILKSMKPESYLINISRGGCVDEEALREALKLGVIAGAGLDVFETEPLPAESALWDTKNVIITPHIGGMSDIYKHQAIGRVIKNLNSYARHGSAQLDGMITRNLGEPV